MHSVIYRTEVLRASGLELPKHTFYVDNLFVYQPLPQVKTIYYLNLDLYRYFVGRDDQSVNEKNVIKRVDQQLRVTRLMMNAVDLFALPPEQEKLAYMFNYFSMMMAISSIFLALDGSEEALAKRKQLWEDLKAHDERLYRRCRHSVAQACNLPGWAASSASAGTASPRNCSSSTDRWRLWGSIRRSFLIWTALSPTQHRVILNSVRHACRQLPLELPEEATLRRFWDRHCPASFREYLHLDETGAARAVAAFREYYPHKGIFENEVYSGIPELLADLKVAGRQVVLATSKPEAFAQQIWTISLWPGSFDAICGATIDDPAPIKGRSLPTPCRNSGHHPPGRCGDGRGPGARCAGRRPQRSALHRRGVRIRYG